MRYIAIVILLTPLIMYAQDSDTLISSSDYYSYKTGDHELFIMPTAHAMAHRQSYLGSYEVVLLNYTLGIGRSSHVGVYVLPFPSLEGGKGGLAVALLGKHTYYNSPTFSGAAWGMFNINGAFIIIGNTFSYEFERIGLHGGFGFLNYRPANRSVFFSLGTKAEICEWLYAIAEYTNTTEGAIDIGEEFTGVSLAGLRYRDRHVALDLAAGKIFGGEKRDVVPVVKCVVYF